MGQVDAAIYNCVLDVCMSNNEPETAEQVFQEPSMIFSCSK